MFRWSEGCGYSPDEVERLNASYRFCWCKSEVLLPFYAVGDYNKVSQRGVTYTQGISDEDRLTENKQIVRTFKAPINHVTLYGDGVPIAYPSREAAAKVFLDIEQHIANWVHLTNLGPNMRSRRPPEEDFDLLHEYMEMLHEYVLYYEEEAHNQSELRRATRSRFGTSDTMSDKKGRRRRQDGEIKGLLTNRRERMDDASVKVMSLTSEARLAGETTADTSGLENVVDNLRK